MLHTLQTHSFNSLQPLIAFTAISTPYLSAYFSASYVYLACPSPTQRTLPHLSISPYSCSLTAYIVTLAPLLLISYCTSSNHSLLTLSHITALIDLTDILQPDILAITETWVCTTTTPLEVIDSTTGYTLFSAPRTSETHLTNFQQLEALPSS